MLPSDKMLSRSVCIRGGVENERERKRGREGGRTECVRERSYFDTRGKAAVVYVVGWV